MNEYEYQVCYPDLNDGMPKKEFFKTKDETEEFVIRMAKTGTKPDEIIVWKRIHIL